MKLKNVILSAAIAAAMIGNVAHSAGNGEVSFLGAVTAKTCDIETEVGGAVNNLVQLGEVTKGAEGTAVPFQLKLKDKTACDLTGANAPTSAFVSWGTVSLDDVGVANSRGTAQKASVVLTAKNAKGGNKNVTKAADTTEFEPATVNTDGGFNFEAKLKSDTNGSVGSVDTSAAFTVHYQ